MTEHDTKPLEPFSIPEGTDNPANGTSASNQPDSENRLWAGLAYWTQLVLPAVLPAILLISDYTNKNKYVRYHAIHSLALLIASIIYLIIITIGMIAMSVALPFILCLAWLLYLVPAAIMIFYGVHAYKGEWRPVPWLTGFLKQCRLV